MNDSLYDVVIIGAAAVGCAAAVYAARRGLNAVIITKDIGGEVALSGDVDNWPGTVHTTGVELAQMFHKHAQSYNVPIKNGLAVESIAQEGNIHLVKTKDYNGVEEIFRTKTVVIGSGIHPREMGVPGEKDLKGKGVTYCTVCDGPLYRNKITATIGAGNSGLESALMMSDLAKQVYLITKYADTPETKGGFPKGETILVEKIKARPNVTIIYNADTTEILGTDSVQGVRYKDTVTGEAKEIATNGVMVHVGMIPNSSFANGLTKNAQGEIEINLRCETNIPGIYAAGDVSSVPYKQIVIAAGTGVIAMLSAIDYINRWKAA
jgi:alkyl hydroperoxide reductase subunit AhpF